MAPFHRWFAVEVDEPSHSPTQLSVPEALDLLVVLAALLDVAEAAALKVTATRGHDASAEPVPVNPGSPVW